MQVEHSKILLENHTTDESVELVQQPKELMSAIKENP